MKLKLLSLSIILLAFASCKKDKSNETDFFVNEDAATFSEIGSIDIGDVGAAEISAYDPQTKRLFVVNNGTVNKIDILDFSDPTNIKVISSIATLPYGGAVNSLAVNDGKLAAAIESTNKQANGKVVVFKTSDYSLIKSVEVGALPDMITFTPDGKFILTANEGEPNNDYTNDPLGTISIISVGNYSVKTLDFSYYVIQSAWLKSKGFRVFGPSGDFAKDIEPEYITVSEDSKTAWVTLQENNGIAKIDLTTKSITNIFPLGFKDYNVSGNEIDASDKDSKMSLASCKVKGIYMPDGIAILQSAGGIPFLFTANEGDAREYTAFAEIKRVKDVSLDATVFPDGATLKTEAVLGRLNITTTLGDTDGDGDFDALYSLGARSFSVWNGNDGSLIFDSKNELDSKAILANYYDDGRSDDKGAEPEGIAIGTVGNKKIAFIGLERADAVAIYDVTTPTAPKFLQIIKCGDAPEGVLFIEAKNSPTKKSLLIISSENDGVIKVFTPSTI